MGDSYNKLLYETKDVDSCIIKAIVTSRMNHYISARYFNKNKKKNNTFSYQTC